MTPSRTHAEPPLDAPVDRLTIRPEVPGDFPAVARVHGRAFDGEDEARLVDALRRSDAFVPGLSLVAAERAEVVGHILFTRICIKDGGVTREALALAPLAVLPERQRRAIGSALVERGLAECRRLGHRIVIVLGHPEYYPRFGFTPAGERGLRGPFPVRPEAFMVLGLVPGALDGVRGEIEYPPEFGRGSG